MSEAKKRMGRQKTASKMDNTSAVGSTHFIGIGINDYQNWPSLQNAVRDVQAIADLLVSGYGFNKNQLRLLLNEEATEANIINLFEDLANQVEPVDSLLIYYAGHGHLNQRGRGFWVPVDAPEGSVFRYIRNSTIKDYIGDINSLHTLLISDACFSGSLFSSGTERASELVADELARLPSRWAICSGRHDEVVADGPAAGHSPFAESILDVLRNNSRPAITTAFLVNQVIEQTRSNYEQLPDGGPLQNVGHKRGQFVFRRQGKEGINKQWKEIQTAADGEISEIRAKKKLIRRFITDYPDNDHMKAALALGRQMEQKKAMLDAWDSEFGLIAFVQQDSPYREEAQARLDSLQNKEQKKSFTLPLEESLKEQTKAIPKAKKQSFSTSEINASAPQESNVVKAAKDSKDLRSFSEIALVIKKNLIITTITIILSAIITYTLVGISPDPQEQYEAGQPAWWGIFSFFVTLFLAFQAYKAGQKAVDYNAPVLIFLINFFLSILINIVFLWVYGYELSIYYLLGSVLSSLLISLPGFIVVFILKRRLQKAR